MKFFKDIPEDVAKVVHEMMSKWRIPQVIDKIDEEHRDTPGKAWVSEGQMTATGLEPRTT